MDWSYWCAKDSAELQLVLPDVIELEISISWKQDKGIGGCMWLCLSSFFNPLSWAKISHPRFWSLFFFFLKKIMSLVVHCETEDKNLMSKYSVLRQSHPFRNWIQKFDFVGVTHLKTTSSNYMIFVIVGSDFLGFFLLCVYPFDCLCEWMWVWRAEI